MSLPQRCAIQQAVSRAVDSLGIEYDLLSDDERSLNLGLAASKACDVADGGHDPTVALIDLMAEAQAWLEVLQAVGAR